MSAGPDVFLSYSREDQAAARRFAQALEAQGFAVWWDATLRTGEQFDQVIEKALNEARAVVVLWSKSSVDSRWVRAEATTGDRNKTLAPVLIEACQRPIIFELTHTADLTHWNGDLADPAWRIFVADVRRLVERGAPQKAGVPAGTDSHRPGAAIPGYRSRGMLIAGTALGILIAAGLTYALRRPGTPILSGLSHPAAQSSAPVAPAQTAPSGTSLAVLPFINMSRDPDQEYFSDGLTEELLNQLAQINGLEVTARTSSFSFKGKNEDVRVIAQKLGVNHLLEGSVQKSGDDLRITAQLIDAVTGGHLWSKTYDRKLAGAFAVQDEIAKDVASALAIKLEVGAMARNKGGTTNVDAYDKYLHALTATDNVKVAALCREALALDPDFALALRTLYVALFFSEVSDANQREMDETSARLVAMAPDAWFTQDVLSSQLAIQHRWSEAEAARRAALAKAPSVGDINANLGMLLVRVGRIQEGVDYLRRATQIDPLSLYLSDGLMIGLTIAGDRDEIPVEYARSKEFVGDRFGPELMLLTSDLRRPDADPKATRERLRKVLNLAQPRFARGITAEDIGNRQAIVTLLNKDFEATQSAPKSLLISMLADLFGDKDLALTALRRGFVDLKQREVEFMWFDGGSGVRTDPRFKQLARDLKLDNYWRTSGKWADNCHPVGSDDFECH